MVVGIFAGCMSLNIGRTSNHVTSDAVSEDGVYLQQGVARLKGGGEAEVHYPIAYQRLPNVELDDDSDHCEIVEQHEDHFKVRNTSPFKAEAHWKARGVRVASAIAPPAVPATPPPDPPPPAVPPAVPESK
jgi:hypothetical protein